MNSEPTHRHDTCEIPSGACCPHAWHTTHLSHETLHCWLNVTFVIQLSRLDLKQSAIPQMPGKWDLEKYMSDFELLPTGPLTNLLVTTAIKNIHIFIWFIYLLCCRCPVSAPQIVFNTKRHELMHHYKNYHGTAVTKHSRTYRYGHCVQSHKHIFIINVHMVLDRNHQIYNSTTLQSQSRWGSRYTLRHTNPALSMSSALNQHLSSTVPKLSKPLTNGAVLTSLFTAVVRHLSKTSTIMAIYCPELSKVWHSRVLWPTQHIGHLGDDFTGRMTQR